VPAVRPLRNHGERRKKGKEQKQEEEKEKKEKKRRRRKKEKRVQIEHRGIWAIIIKCLKFK
jgi:hypothetical protein